MRQKTDYKNPLHLSQKIKLTNQKLLKEKKIIEIKEDSEREREREREKGLKGRK